jgi:tetratricopeptide (TPR) repeat protein
LFNIIKKIVFFIRADLYVEKKELYEALTNYTYAIKYDPNNYMAYFKRAKIYEIRGETRMSMDDYLTTTRLNPKFYDAWFCHGMNYYNNNNWHYAIVDFTELIANCPKNQSKARLYRGKCNLNLGEYQEALNDFGIAIHLNPMDWESYYHRGCLLRK